MEDGDEFLDQSDVPEPPRKRRRVEGSSNGQPQACPGSTDSPERLYVDLSDVLPLKHDDSGLPIVDPALALAPIQDDQLELSDEQRVIYTMAMNGESMFFTGFVAQPLPP